MTKNEKIARSIFKGGTLIEVGELFGIHFTRARQILHAFCINADRKLYDSLYLKLSEYDQGKPPIKILRMNEEKFLKANEKNKVHNFKFMKPEDAPKDRPFLAFFKNKYCFVLTGWNDVNKHFITSQLQRDSVGGWGSTYFQNEYYDEKDLVKWCELPEG